MYTYSTSSIIRLYTCSSNLKRAPCRTLWQPSPYIRFRISVFNFEKREIYARWRTWGYGRYGSSLKLQSHTACRVMWLECTGALSCCGGSPRRSLPRRFTLLDSRNLTSKTIQHSNAYSWSGIKMNNPHVSPIRCPRLELPWSCWWWA